MTLLNSNDVKIKEYNKKPFELYLKGFLFK